MFEPDRPMPHLFPEYSRAAASFVLTASQFFEHVRDVGRGRWLGNVELSGDSGGGVAELLGGGLGVDSLGDQLRHHLAERSAATTAPGACRSLTTRRGDQGPGRRLHGDRR